MKLFLVRHGETDHNAKKLLVSITDVPLNEKGREQARLLAKRLKNEQIDVIISSPLSRARETAEIIAEQHGKKVIVSKELIERNFGALEREPTSKLREAVAASGKEFYDFTPENGESDMDVQKRIVPFVESMIKKYNGKNLLLVTHGVIVMEILFHFTKKPRHEWEQLCQNNTSLNVIEINERGHDVKLINCTKHLD
jgi:broad specificity phosphatase PhoE